MSPNVENIMSHIIQLFGNLMFQELISGFIGLSNRLS